jgi:hypothetical protein
MTLPSILPEVSIRHRLVSVVLLAALAAGCGSRAQHSGRAASVAPGVELSDAAAARRAWARDIRLLAARGEYDAVDSIAAGLRRDHECWDNGWLKLGTLYYEGFGDLGDRESEGQWRALVGKLAEWRHERPGSITAPVAYAYACTGWAWCARGNGYSNTVSDEGGAMFEKRLERARLALDEAQQLDDRDPYWYSAMQTVALGQGWSREDYERLFEAGVAAHPDCWMLYKKKAHYLLPRWYGARGEWESYAIAVTNDQPDSNRDVLYADMIWYLDTFHRNIFDETEASWYRVAHGFDELIRRHPESLEVANAYAKFATLAGDRPRARAAFDRIGLKCDVGVWKKAEFFQAARDWALAPPS